MVHERNYERERNFDSGQGSFAVVAKIWSRDSRVVVTCRIITHSFECVIIFFTKQFTICGKIEYDTYIFHKVPGAHTACTV